MPASCGSFSLGSSSFGLTSTTLTRKEIEALGEILGLHELAVEDTQEFGQRTKADAYGEELLFVYGAKLDSDSLPVSVEVHLHVSSAVNAGRRVSPASALGLLCARHRRCGA
jgi:Mg2+ and Co2+ transporter CorA